MVNLAMELPLDSSEHLSLSSGLNNVKSISAGTSHSCAALDNGSAMCWGSNGQWPTW